MHITADTLIAGLRGKGLRITRARRAICAVLAERHDEHLNATAILERARSRGGQLNLSTVYRTIDELEALGLVTHAHLGHGGAVYHLSEEGDHQHLVCERCGRAVAVSSAELREMVSPVIQRYGFVPDSLHFALFGHCVDCVPPAD